MEPFGTQWQSLISSRIFNRLMWNICRLFGPIQTSGVSSVERERLLGGLMIAFSQLNFLHSLLLKCVRNFLLTQHIVRAVWWFDRTIKSCGIVFCVADWLSGILIYSTLLRETFTVSVDSTRKFSAAFDYSVDQMELIIRMNTFNSFLWNNLKYGSGRC